MAKNRLILHSKNKKPIILLPSFIIEKDANIMNKPYKITIISVNNFTIFTSKLNNNTDPM